MATVEYRGVVLDKERRTVTRGKRQVNIAGKEFDILWALFEKQGRIVSHSFLAQAVWGKVRGTDSTMRVHVGRIRRKMGKFSITTVNSYGYAAGEMRP